MTDRPDRPAAAPRGTFLQRLRVAAIEVAAGLVRHLPASVVQAIGDVGGELEYRLLPARVDLARRNLARVVESLAARGLGGPRVAAAATNPKALERLVRLACRHHVRYYLDILRLTAAVDLLHDPRFVVETPAEVDAAFETGRPLIFLSGHFGALELAGVYLSQRTGRQAISAMETLADPELQAWFQRTRDRTGLRIADLRSARREILDGIRRGDPIALVADRDITGGGIEVPLFGHPASLPIGPALVALESGGPVHVAGIRRVGAGAFHGRLYPVEFEATEGTRRERLAAVVRGIAAAFELMIAEAPEQWWAVFFPIWRDLEPAAEPAPTGRAPEAAS